MDRGKETAKDRDRMGRLMGADVVGLMGHVWTLMSTLREVGAIESL